MSFLIGENMTGGYGGANIINCTISVDLGQIAVIVYLMAQANQPP